MVRTAEYDPIVVEPAITPQKIEELLNRGMESAKLDYKEQYEPGHACDRFRLTKHVAAMANSAGGYIVIGVTDDGRAVGVSDTDARAMDEAVIRSQIAGSVNASITLYVQNDVEWNGLQFVIVTVLPHKSTVVVLDSDGQCHDGDRHLHVFRRGDVLVRHGSASERWTQDDADYLTERIALRRKDRWLREFTEDFGRVIQLLGGQVALETIGPEAYELSDREFRDLVVRLLRNG